MDIIQNKKIKKFIFRRLFEELSNKSYYPYGRELWIVDFDNKEWYFHYTSDGNLYYNYTYFNSFFTIFSLQYSEYQKILKIWFENMSSNSVNRISRRKLNAEYYIDGIERGEDKQWSLNERYGYSYSVVKKYLSLKNDISNKNIKLENFLSKDGIY